MGITAVSTQQFAQIPKRIDLLLCACGYEGRAVAVAEQLAQTAATKIAVGFRTQQEVRYDENAAWFRKNGFQLIDVSDAEYEQTVRGAFRVMREMTGGFTVVVDISCLNRVRLARLVRALEELEAEGEVFLAYNLAKYSPPAEDLEPTSVAEPVIPEFAGWTNYPERPPAAIIGLGYEPSRAIGIVDHLEINNAAWAFVPQGPIGEYSATVDAANRSLLEMISVEGRWMCYDVMNPGALFHELNALAASLKQIYNPILIPFGPKIFAAVALLVASMHDGIGVWRVSSGTLQSPVDRRASEHTTYLRIRMES